MPIRGPAQTTRRRVVRLVEVSLVVGAVMAFMQEGFNGLNSAAGFAERLARHACDGTLVQQALAFASMPALILFYVGLADRAFPGMVLLEPGGPGGAAEDQAPGPPLWDRDLDEPGGPSATGELSSRADGPEVIPEFLPQLRAD